MFRNLFDTVRCVNVLKFAKLNLSSVEGHHLFLNTKGNRLDDDVKI